MDTVGLGPTHGMYTLLTTWAVQRFQGRTKSISLATSPPLKCISMGWGYIIIWGCPKLILNHLFQNQGTGNEREQSGKETILFA